MRLAYDRLQVENLRGDTQADYLIALDGHLEVLHDGRVILSAPNYPVVELARALGSWLSGTAHDDFLFDSMSFEELGTVAIRRSGRDWEFTSALTPGEPALRVTWDEVRHALQEFVNAVDDNLAALGLDPAHITHR